MKKQRYAFIISAISALLLSGCFYSHEDSSSSDSSSEIESIASSSSSMIESSLSSEKEIDLSDFLVINQNSRTFEGRTDSSGSIWALFSPTSDGLMNVPSFTYDTTLAIYDFTELGYNYDRLNYPTMNAIAYASRLTSPFNQKIDDFVVYSGHHYVFKQSLKDYENFNIDWEIAANKDIGVGIHFDFSYTPYTIKSYNGPGGELMTFFSGQAFNHARLNFEILKGAKFENGCVIYRKESTYDLITDKENPYIQRYTNTFVLNELDRTFTYSEEMEAQHIFNIVTETTTSVSGLLGPDNNMWAMFTPTNDGLIWIDDTTNQSYVSHLALYQKKAVGASLRDYHDFLNTFDGSLKALNAYEPYVNTASYPRGNNHLLLHEFVVEGGKTYIIKFGHAVGNALSIGEFYRGYGDNFYDNSPASFSFRYEELETTSFTGDDGVVTLETYNGKLENVKVKGSIIRFSNMDYDDESKILRTYGVCSYYSVDTSIDPTLVRREKEYRLNFNNLTYSFINHGNVTHHIINEIFPNSTYKATTGEDGSFYCKFVAPSNGSISFACTKYINAYEETISVFDASKPGTTASHFRYGTRNEDNGTYMGKDSFRSEGMGEKSFPVKEGRTYVIKVSDLYSTTIGIGDILDEPYYVNSRGEIELFFYQSN